MEALLNSIPYRNYHRYLLIYQVGATVLVCLPVFLSIFILIGLPHFFFLILMALVGKGSPGPARRVLHAVMFLYYAALLIITLKLWPEIQGEWAHADSVDFLIRAQMMLLPLILTIQLPFVAFEWVYPILLPHELLEQQASARREAE
jgi:hypothetical protein